MSWVSLGDALENALAKALEVYGDAGVGAPAVIRKRTRTEARAKSRESLTGKPVESLPANEVDASREIAVATPAPRRATAPRVAAISLVVDNMGGRTEAGGDTPVRPMLKPYRGDGRANWLKLVSG